MTDLYRTDYYAWAHAQADALGRRSANEIDWENLKEEVEDLAGQKESELHSRFARLLQHLLKWRFQPERQSRSWALTVKEQRSEIKRLGRKSPSLRPKMEEIMEEAYEVARLRAARETKLDEELFPEASPFSLEDVLEMEVKAPDQDQPRSKVRKVKL